MWERDSGRGEPIGWIDGVPLYADGSRGRKVQDPAILDGGGAAYGRNEDRRSGATDGPNRGFSVAAQQDSAGAPTFESLVQHDNSSGRRAKSSLRFIVPAVVIASIVLSGVFNMVTRAVDGVRDAARNPSGTFTIPDPLEERGPATARGRYSGQVHSITGNAVSVLRPDGSGMDVLLLPEDQPTVGQTLRERTGSWAMVSWEQRGGELHVVGATPFPARAVGTLPPH